MTSELPLCVWLQKLLWLLLILLSTVSLCTAAATAARLVVADLSDKFVHLTNHCIAETHPDFGKFEPTNEMFYAEFDGWLDSLAAAGGGGGEGTTGSGGGQFTQPHQRSSQLESVILPQIKRQVALTIEAARSKMEVAVSASVALQNLVIPVLHMTNVWIRQFQ